MLCFEVCVLLRVLLDAFLTWVLFTDCFAVSGRLSVFYLRNRMFGTLTSSFEYLYWLLNCGTVVCPDILFWGWVFVIAVCVGAVGATVCTFPLFYWLQL